MKYFRGVALAICAATALTSAAAAADMLPSGASYEVGFSPAGTALPLIVRGIERARTSIHVAAYSFTSKPIAAALVAAQRRGVRVAVVADKAQNSRGYSAVWFLANQGVPVRLNDRYQDQHNKFMVIDGSDVETGSFNFSSSASYKNAENVLLLKNVPRIAAQYEAEWDRLWQEGTDMERRY
ncbi:phospholipase D family nuclease [Burkholderia multivorans]|uniref:phospholipase D family nuclease n=1 Tax=Burkholderia multivorans TaxID=87883 RepID=UPI0005801032|nr:phospholipase D family protein [Burkholderia multivorans]KHS09457.1 endonuclease [Burkholderia multivorans]KHS10409.1 endonuclease [Burkholderia multivorans]MDR9230043.1 Phospholipase D [Burkholderia multivorans]HDR9474408.1 phospholipase D family protein [Burkholderia multivorans]HDR9480250.1 phospholipase D family protein [Burkholderia multivorans]